jgi:SAM-dependent methyltransferase
MMSEFKDLFSGQATDYAKFRPNYPASLFEYLASVVGEHDLVWDCGTGNGQAAIRLAERFQKIIATDPSEKQISSATPHAQVEYRVGAAEKSPLGDHSAILITVAQAFHWFRQDEFFHEVKRVLKPGGVLAIWCYELAKITPEIDRVVDHLYRGILGGYWEKERRLVEEGYRKVVFPLLELTPPKLEMTAQWSLAPLVGYLGTWSALQTFIKKNGQNPLEAIFPELKKAWGEVPLREVRWELGIRVGRA